MEPILQFRDLLANGHDREALQFADKALRSKNPKELFELMAVALWDRAESGAGIGESTREALYRAAITLQQKAHSPYSEGAWIASWHLAAFLERSGDLDAAESAYRSMIAVAERLLDSEPALMERSLSRYAALLMRRGELEEAEGLMRRVIASLEKNWPGRKERESQFGKKGPSLLEALSELHRNLLQQGKVNEAETVATQIANIRAANPE